MDRRGQTIVAMVVVGGLLAVLGGVAVATGSGVGAVGDLMRDPVASADLPWWTGSVSVVTRLLWASAGTLFLATSLLSRGPRHQPFAALGVLTIVLTLDDSLNLHESALPSVGVPEEVLYACYAAAAAGIAVRMWPARGTEVGGAFFVGGALFGVATVWDAFVPVTLYLVEDGAKLAGVVAWLLCSAWALRDAVSVTRHSGTHLEVD